MPHDHHFLTQNWSLQNYGAKYRISNELINIHQSAYNTIFFLYLYKLVLKKNYHSFKPYL